MRYLFYVKTIGAEGRGPGAVSFDIPINKDSNVTIFWLYIKFHGRHPPVLLNPILFYIELMFLEWKLDYVKKSWYLFHKVENVKLIFSFIGFQAISFNFLCGFSLFNVANKTILKPISFLVQFGCQDSNNELANTDNNSLVSGSFWNIWEHSWDIFERSTEGKFNMSDMNNKRKS